MADKTKKRKRTAEEPANPSKKAAVQKSNKNVKFSIQSADQWVPVVASTPGLSMPTSIALKPFSKPRKNAPQRSGASGAITSTELLLQSSSHPSIDYLAREEEAGGSDAILKHYVGVYDPATGEIEVMEARRMVVRGAVRSQQVATEGEVSTNMRELRNTLGQTFGTKKARKAIASVTENAIAPAKSERILANAGKAPKLDATSSAMLASMKAATEGMATRAELAEAADSTKPRPKANTSATNVKDVYTVENIIGNEILSLVPVREWQEAAKANKNVVFLSQYVANRMHKIALSGDVQKLRILRYLLCLFDFYNTSKPDRVGRKLGKRSDVAKAMGDVPESIVENIKRKFSTAGVISKFQCDLLITHMCALACLVDNFEVDTWDLKEDLKLETKEMSQYFHEIGTRIVPPNEAQRKALGLDKAAAAQRKFAKLRIPLDFPRVNFPRGKR